MNFNCTKHHKVYSCFCDNCYINLCDNCIKIHEKEHHIILFDDIIPLNENINNIFTKKDKIIADLENIKQILDVYKNEFIRKIELIKNYYEMEIILFKKIINQYSTKKYNYQIIKNLENIVNFSLDDDTIKSDDSFSVKTEKILNIVNRIENNPKIKLIKNLKMKETVYSLCYIKKYNLIALGLDKRVVLIDLSYKIISSNQLFENKIAYIHELKNGKIVVVNLNKFVKILQVNDDGKLDILESVETEEEKNFVITELENENIICGGNKYLSIIELKFSFFKYKYSLQKTIDLNSFISNIIELDKDNYLVGLSHLHKIAIYSSEKNMEKYHINNINIRSNNYSISKISEDLIAMAGWEESTIRKACIFILSINTKSICQKFYMEKESFMVSSKLNNNKIVAIGMGLDEDNYSDLVVLNYKKDLNKIVIYKYCEFRRGHCDTIEAIIIINNFIIASDSSSNLKIWQVD